ncbi:MAG TPA: hemolysin family protein [Candidatus Ozemobacteraceae bacterium]|mgnify:CR=1 FL=1|nr:hemolysin family protein [Candidatus Ozemobacteraceae bacterium]
MTILISLAMVLICLFLVAAYAGIETGFVSLDLEMLKHRALDPEAVAERTLVKILRQPERFLALTLIGINMTMVLATAVWTELLKNYSPALVTVGTVTMSLVILLFCELLPKMIFAARPLEMSRKFIPLVSLSDRLLNIPIIVVTWFTRGFMKLLGLGGDRKRRKISREELLILLSQGASSGVLRDKPTRMARGIIGLKDTHLCEIMIPRPRITALDVTVSLENARKLVMEGGYSRIPVYEGRIDQVIGILYFKDLFLNPQQPVSLREMISPPVFVPESKNAFEQLQDMRRGNYHAVLVLDEFGSLAGLVTLEDLLEEVFGEIQDELDEPVTSVKFNTDGTVTASADLSLADFRRETGIAFIETEGASTINGLILASTGRIPVTGDRFDIDGYPFEILLADGRRVVKVRITMGIKERRGLSR